VPEGDTIHRTADRLAVALAGRPLVRLVVARTAAWVRPPRPGTVITAVEARGKHVLIRFADGVTLRTHMRMTGSWHLYPTGERWRKPQHLARAVVEVDGWVAVCFSAPVVELARDDEAIAHLGPDLTVAGRATPEVAADSAAAAPAATGSAATDRAAAEPDGGDRLARAVDAALARMAAIAPGEEIGVVLLDQRVVSGIGNVFKSEVLFACGVDPFAPIASVDDATRRRLVETASRQLAASVASNGPRTTVRGAPPGTVAVYRRSGQPCLRCGTPIRTRRQGEQARSTYWCPTCQPPAVTPPVVPPAVPDRARAVRPGPDTPDRS
jgi:endonuclease-8